MSSHIDKNLQGHGSAVSVPGKSLKRREFAVVDNGDILKSGYFSISVKE